MERPETVEGRWDILYREYPEVYEEFARIPKRPTAIQVLDERFPLAGKTVVDVGSGSGLSTFELAQYARFVIGVEPEDSMRAIAVESQRRLRIDNVRLLKGTAEDLPLEDDSADVVAGITLSNADYTRAALEMERVAKAGGLVLRVDVAPGWYGGELNPEITGEPREETPARGSLADVLTGLGYGHVDFFTDQDYGSVERLVQTYGFIHGKRAIEYARANLKTTIRWKFRIHYKRAGQPTEQAGRRA